MKWKLNKRSAVILISLCAILLAATGTTIAYYVVTGNLVANTFTPAHVDCQVVWDGVADATVTNTGDADAYIRVKIVATWKDANGAVYAQLPQQDRDYVLTQTLGADWLPGSDGFYYFRYPIAPGEFTLPLIDGYTANNAKAPAGYTLSLELVASAIQATTEAVNAWSDGVAHAATDGAQLTVH